MNDLPRITYIQLGLHKQPINKDLIYLKIYPKEKFSFESISNVQYISMFHEFINPTTAAPSSSENSEKKNKSQRLYSIPEENLEYKIDMITQGREAWVGQNMFEIAMNEYLFKEDQSEADKKKESDDPSNTDNEKKAKIFGSNEFMWMFNLILKQIRHHRPSLILFSYDFTLGHTHNHIYDLKPNVLGYFMSMLSSISNHHTTLLLNTDDMNHLPHEQ